MLDSCTVVVSTIPGHQTDTVAGEKGDRAETAVISMPNSSCASDIFAVASIPSVVATSRAALSWAASWSSVEIGASVNSAICGEVVVLLFRGALGLHELCRRHQHHLHLVGDRLLVRCALRLHLFVMKLAYCLFSGKTGA